MRFGATLLSLVAVGTACVAAAPANIEARDVADIKAAIKEIKADTKTLTAKVKEFEGSPLDSIAILIDSGKLDSQIKDTTELVQDSPAFTSKEGNQVVTQLAGLVKPINKSLSAIIDKYDVFKAVLQAWLVKDTLETLSTDQDALIAALLEKVPKGQQPLVQAGAQIIKKKFDQAIAVYEGN